MAETVMNQEPPCGRCGVPVEEEALDLTFRLNCNKCYMYRRRKDRYQWANVINWRLESCTVCQDMYTFLKVSVLHVCSRTYHVSSFMCPRCGLHLESEETRDKHVKYLHEDQKDIVRSSRCKDCGKDVPDIVAHKRVHYKPFKCDICLKSFRDSSHLNRHQRVHTDIKPFVCDSCGKTFDTWYNLEVHSRRAHTFKPHPCPVCKKRFAEPDHLLKHSTTHVEKQYECGTCRKRYMRFRNFRAHLKTHVKELKCVRCSKTFQLEVHLKAHLLQHEKLDKRFMCKTCETKFPSSKHLKSHVLTVHNKPFTCKVCNTNFGTPLELTEHYALHNVPYQCGSCEERFTTFLELGRHMEVHGKYHRCKLCDMGFSSFSELGKHLNTHSSFKRFPCAGCNRSFSKTSYLRKHKEKCVSPNSEISQPKLLENSDPLEQGDSNKSFKCEYCKESFPKQLLLKNHVQCAHCYKCNQCKAVFSKPNLLEMHRKVKHSVKAFRCDVCNKKSFSNVISLRNHKARFHLVKPKIYQCDICDKVFTQSSRFKLHFMRHLGVTPFECKTCSASFDNARALRVHLLTADNCRKEGFSLESVEICDLSI